jgi:hypothetical protein
MKTTSLAKQILGAATVAMALIGCVDGGDMMNVGARMPAGETQAAPAGETSSSLTMIPGTRVRPSSHVRVRFDPTRAGYLCRNEASPSALVQTSATPGVDVPRAVGFRYRLDHTPSIHVAVYVRNLCGGHLGRLDFYAPDGRLYTRRPALFVADGEGTGARRVGDGYVIEVELPIAGTDIAGLPMVGAWSVNFTVDGQEQALGLGLFELYR